MFDRSSVLPRHALARVVVAFIVVGVILSGLLGPLGFVGLVTWTILLAGIAMGAYVFVRAGKPLVAAGAVLMPLSTWLAIFVQPRLGLDTRLLCGRAADRCGLRQRRVTGAPGRWRSCG